MLVNPNGWPAVWVALDYQSLDSALALVKKLKNLPVGFKIGHRLCESVGTPRVMRALRKITQQPIFRDGKFADTADTMAAVGTDMAQLEVDIFTVYALAGKQAMSAACLATQTEAEKLGASRPKVIAVTVLTNLEANDLSEIGMSQLPLAKALQLAELAYQAGCDGVVASPLEITAMRDVFGPDFLVVTPGVRTPDATPNNHQRFATPTQAMEWGATSLVIGREITGSTNPRATAIKILKDIRAL